MKNTQLITALLLICCIGKARQPIKTEDISKHTGDSIKVCDKVYQAAFALMVQGSPTFLFVGNSLPNNPLTTLMDKTNMANFEEAS